MGPGVLPMTPKQSDRVLNGFVRHPLALETEIPKVPHQEHVDNFFFDSRGVVHKEFVPEGKTVNAEFYKEVKDGLLKRIQCVRPAASCSRDFFYCTIMRPSTKLQVFPSFDPPKMLQNFINPLPPYSPDLSPPDSFLFPKLKMKLKGLHFAEFSEIQEAITDELKKVQKEEFSAALQKLYDRTKPVYMPMELILNKKVCVFNLKKNQF